MRALRLTAAAALTLWALVACSDDSTPSTPDPGIAACQAALDSYESGEGGDDIPVAVVAGLKASRNDDLKAVGAEFERFNAMSGDEVANELDALIAALEKFGTGCAAVGVTLPDEMINPAG